MRAIFRFKIKNPKYGIIIRNMGFFGFGLTQENFSAKICNELGFLTYNVQKEKFKEEIIMKKAFSIVLALIMAIFISGKASAANWEVIDSAETEDKVKIITSIDKDSIKRGTDSKQLPKFNRTDGFSAIMKLEILSDKFKIDDSVFLVSFYEEKGERMYCLLDYYSNGPDYKVKESEVTPINVDISGSIWPKVWNFIENNLK